MSDSSLSAQNEQKIVTKYNINNIEKVKLNREDFEDEESYQRMRALRRAIRKINKDQSVVKKEQRIVSYKNISVKDVQLFQNLDFSQKMFVIYGDFFILTDHQKQNIDIQEQISFFKNIKCVLSAQKFDQKQILFLNLGTKDTIQHTPIGAIQKLIQSRPGDQMLQNFLPYLQLYYESLENQKQIVSYLNSVYTEDHLMQIKQLRNEYYDKKVQEYIQQNYTQLDFYMFYKYSQSGINDHYLQFTKIGLSYSLIALLGTDPDTFINISMRNGFMEFSTKSNKQEAIFRSLACLLQLIQLREIRCQDKVTLLTFDEYQIDTILNIHCFIIDYPPELNIEVNGTILTSEMCHFIDYQIDENIIQSIIAKRTKNPQFQQQWENEEFGYTIESQLFLEKYYKQPLENKLNKIEQQYIHQKRYYYNKECNYKQIQDSQNDGTNQQDQSNQFEHFVNNFYSN